MEVDFGFGGHGEEGTLWDCSRNSGSGQAMCASLFLTLQRHALTTLTGLNKLKPSFHAVSTVSN